MWMVVESTNGGGEKPIFWMLGRKAAEVHRLPMRLAEFGSTGQSKECLMLFQRRSR